MLPGLFFWLPLQLLEGGILVQLLLQGICILSHCLHCPCFTVKEMEAILPKKTQNILTSFEAPPGGSLGPWFGTLTIASQPFEGHNKPYSWTWGVSDRSLRRETCTHMRQLCRVYTNDSILKHVTFFYDASAECVDKSFIQGPNSNVGVKSSQTIPRCVYLPKNVVTFLFINIWIINWRKKPAEIIAHSCPHGGNRVKWVNQF